MRLIACLSVVVLIALPVNGQFGPPHGPAFSRPPPGAFSPGNSYVFCTKATFVARLIVDHNPGKDRTYNPSVAYNEA